MSVADKQARFCVTRHTSCIMRVTSLTLMPARRAGACDFTHAHAYTACIRGNASCDSKEDHQGKGKLKEYPSNARNEDLSLTPFDFHCDPRFEPSPFLYFFRALYLSRGMEARRCTTSSTDSTA